MSVSPLDAQGASFGYERLREAALDGREVSRARWGLSLLMNRGFLVWMKTWIKAEEMGPRARPKAQAHVAELSREIALPDALEGRMVAVLAGMVLGALRKGAA